MRAERPRRRIDLSKLIMRVAVLTFLSTGLAYTYSFVHAKCPTCPATVHEVYKLGNQTSGVCYYNAPRHCTGFVCAYWVRNHVHTYLCQYNELIYQLKLTGGIEDPTPISNQSSVKSPPSSPLCPTTVPLTEAGCAFYTIGGVHD
jgi:hypothetical protein